MDSKSDCIINRCFKILICFLFTLIFSCSILKKNKEDNVHIGKYIFNKKNTYSEVELLENNRFIFKFNSNSLPFKHKSEGNYKIHDKYIYFYYDDTHLSDTIVIKETHNPKYDSNITKFLYYDNRANLGDYATFKINDYKEDFKFNEVGEATLIDKNKLVSFDINIFDKKYSYKVMNNKNNLFEIKYYYSKTNVNLNIKKMVIKKDKIRYDKLIFTYKNINNID
jgi:hypothetical protein